MLKPLTYPPFHLSRVCSILCSPFKLLLSLLLLFIALTATGQHWIQKAGGLTVDEGYAIDVDGSGNTYTTGYFTGSASFGSTTLSSSGSTDIFITKTDNNGNFQWAVKAGGSGSDRGINITTDSQGNSYITGYFNGTASFGTVSLTSSGNQDVFIAKYDNAGILQWAVKAGGTGSDQGSGISLDNTGNVLVTGEFRGTATFGATSLTAAGTNSDVFTTKLNSFGSFIWTEHGSGSLTVRGIDVTTDLADNVYVIGQFSGDVTFDVLHTNTMYNVIFLIKYNSSGQEQWFRVIGGGGSNIANAITSDGLGNVYLTGDFSGNLTFFGSPNYVLTNTYSNKVFVAKYSGTGGLTWATASGSNNSISSSDITVDINGNSYIVGHFTCKFGDHADNYGQGTFNSVGYNDVFISKYNSSGNHQLSRQVGGRRDDYGYGIAVNSSGNIHYTGSFKQTLFIPTSGNFNSSNLALWSSTSCLGNSPYCSDNNYGEYHGVTTSGNSDVAIMNCFDPSREPYDYYLRAGSGCARPQNPVCIESGCPDTVVSCSSSNINSFTNVCPNTAPRYEHEWSTSPFDTLPSLSAFQSGTYQVTITTEDGCFSRTDSIYVINLPAPSLPTVSDNKGININAVTPTNIELCEPDSVELTAGNLGQNSFIWTGPGLPATGVSDTTILVTQTGQYFIEVTDSNGCSNMNDVTVVISPMLDSFSLQINAQDTYTICEGDAAQFFLYDSVANPTGVSICLDISTTYSVNTQLTISPTTNTSTGCNTYGNIYATVSDTYSISAVVIRSNNCDADTHYLTHEVYIQVDPSPNIPQFTTTIIGSEYICPGDSAILIATGAPNYTWFGNNVLGLTTDTVTIYSPGVYTAASAVADTNLFGCTDYWSSYDAIEVFTKPQPTITTTSTLICPNDSVLLEVNGGGTDFYWEGPNGQILGDSNIYATEAGQYFCVVNDSDSCALVTNTVLLTQYSTPQLLANGDLYLCDGDSVTISVSSNDSSLIEWQSPLSGSGLSQTVYSAGIYTCKITSCGIITYASIEVLPSNPVADIYQNKLLCDDDSITLSGTPGMNSYLWFPTGDTTDTITVFEPGTYVLSIIDSTGCDAVSDSLLVSVVEVNTDISYLGDSVICYGDTLELIAPSGYDKYLWMPENDTDSIYIVTSPGEYYLTITDTNNCTGVADPFDVYMPDTIADIDIFGDLYFCEGDSVNLVASSNTMAQYNWSPINYQGQSIVVYESGSYQLTTIDSFGCVAKSDSIVVQMDSNDLIIPVTKDTTICAGLPVRLFASTPIGTVQWYLQIGGNLIHTGEILNIPSALETTKFFVRSTRTVCSSDYAPVLLNVIDCDNMFTPNVFTPNGDGINDRLLFTIEEATCFNVKIFNRWGILIYESEDMNEGWDGRNQNNGEPVNAGTYYYIVDYCKYNGLRDIKTGYVSLFRE